jgi:membrane protein DedA with SNARE-associated domain
LEESGPGITFTRMSLLALLSPERVEAWVTWGGPFVIFALLFACGLGLPLPEDIPLLVGGYFAGRGEMHLVTVGVLAWVGIIGGDCVLYWLARKYGLNVTRLPLIGRHVTKKRILWAEAKFERYGIWVVAVCRLFAGVRGAMVIAAGAIRYNFLKFLIADGIAALISGGLFVYLGYLAGKHLGSVADMRQRMKHYEHYVIAGIIVAAVLLVAYAVWRHRRHKAEAAAADADGAGPGPRERTRRTPGGAGRRLVLIPAPPAAVRKASASPFHRVCGRGLTRRNGSIHPGATFGLRARRQAGFFSITREEASRCAGAAKSGCSEGVERTLAPALVPVAVGRGSLLRPEVDHEHVPHHGSEDAAERLVVVVGEVGVAVLLRREGEHEAVGEALVVLLRAHVRAPAQRGDAGDLVLQAGEALLDELDLLGRGAGLELQRHDVKKLAPRILRLRLRRLVGADRKRGEDQTQGEDDGGVVKVVHARRR